MRDYEVTVIGKPDLDQTNLAAFVDKVKGYITAEGGVVTKTDIWGLRRLTYPIRKYRDGHYVHMQVQVEGAAVARIEQRIKLLDDAIRYLIVNVEDDGAPDLVSADSAPAAESAPDAAPDAA